MDSIERIDALAKKALSRPQEQKDLEARSNDHRQSQKPGPQVKHAGKKVPRRTPKRSSARELLQEADHAIMMADAWVADQKHPKD